EIVQPHHESILTVGVVAVTNTGFGETEPSVESLRRFVRDPDLEGQRADAAPLGLLDELDKQPAGMAPPALRRIDGDCGYVALIQYEDHSGVPDDAVTDAGDHVVAVAPPELPFEQRTGPGNRMRGLLDGQHGIEMAVTHGRDDHLFARGRRLVAHVRSRL